MDPFFSEGSNEPPGLIRSTDGGETWTHVGGPDADFGAYPISVVGGGAIVYAMQDTGSAVTDGCDLWKTTDGGDGMLTASKNPLVTCGINLPTPSDTLVSMPCDSVSFWLWLEYQASCVRGRLSGVEIDAMDSLGSYHTRMTQHALEPVQTDTAWTTIYPKRPGTYRLTIRAQYMDDDHDVSDTAFHVVLVVKPNPGAFTISRSAPFDFGGQTLCAPIRETDSFSVMANGCENIKLDSVLFRPDSSRFKDFSFSAIRNVSPATDSAAYFPISFKPTIPDTERGTIWIYWSDGELEHVDTIRTIGEGIQATRSFSIAAQALTVQKCDSTTGVITVTNTTCGYLELDSLSLPAGLMLPLQTNGSPQLPIYLQSGASDSLVVTIRPGSEGVGTAALQLGDTTLEVPAHMLYTDKGGTVVFDTTISIAVHVERGPAAELLSDTALDFGTVTGCDSATLPLVVSSAGCDTLSGIGYRVQGMRYRISGTAASLAPGRSDTLYVTFNPDLAGTGSDTLFIGSNTGMKAVPLHGTSAPSASIFSVNTTLRDFGQVFACQERDTTIWLHNPGCDTLTVDSGIFSNGNYASAQTYPIIIPEGDSVPILITYIPAANQGSDNGSVTFYTNANTGPATETVPLQATIIPPVQLHVGLEAPTYAGHDGNVVTFYVILTGDSGAAAKYLSGVSFDLTHNDNLLTFLSANGLGVTGQGAGTAPLHFTASALGTSDTLGTLTFRTYLTDSSETPLTLSNVTFSNSLGLQPDCIASADDSGSGFTYLYNCGDHELQKFLQSGQVLLSIESIVPNPAQDRITVHVVSANAGVLSYQLFDALGNCVIDKQAGAETAPLQARNGEDSSASSGQAPRSTSLQLDVSKLPSGIYFLRVASGGYAVSRSIAIER